MKGKQRIVRSAMLLALVLAAIAMYTVAPKTFDRVIAFVTRNTSAQQRHEGNTLSPTALASIRTLPQEKGIPHSKGDVANERRDETGMPHPKPPATNTEKADVPKRTPAAKGTYSIHVFLSAHTLVYHHSSGRYVLKGGTYEASKVSDAKVDVTVSLILYDEKKTNTQAIRNVKNSVAFPNVKHQELAVRLAHPKPATNMKDDYTFYFREQAPSYRVAVVYDGQKEKGNAHRFFSASDSGFENDPLFRDGIVKVAKGFRVNDSASLSHWFDEQHEDDFCYRITLPLDMFGYREGRLTDETHSLDVVVYVYRIDE